jgi:hypothetical protein
MNNQQETASIGKKLVHPFMALNDIKNALNYSIGKNSPKQFP